MDLETQFKVVDLRDIPDGEPVPTFCAQPTSAEDRRGSLYANVTWPTFCGRSPKVRLPDLTGRCEGHDPR